MAGLKGHEHLGDLRVIDLLAKTAKVNIRDAIRVLVAAGVLDTHLGLTLTQLVPKDYKFPEGKPSPENVAACEQAYHELHKDKKVVRGMKVLNSYYRKEVDRAG